MSKEKEQSLINKKKKKNTRKEKIYLLLWAKNHIVLSYYKEQTGFIRETLQQIKLGFFSYCKSALETASAR